ncbi:MAG TPA: SRPBCC domain-containing protein [Anaerolineae bacterium]|nr:SRPBCC domain-containing protein [Anaerolineae bacterium]
MLKVEQSISIAAKPERVWRAWTAEISKWWTRPYFIDPERVTGLVLEPQLGGRFIEMWGEQGAGYLLGHVIEWLPPQRLAFTWTEKAWTGAATVVWVTLEPEGQGTRVTLVHEGFERLPDGAAQRSGYQMGWGDLLSKSKLHIESV